MQTGGARPREPFAWLGPLTGALSLGTAGLLVAIYAYGLSVPEEHESSRTVEIDASTDAIWSMLTLPERRAQWRPHVVRVVPCGDVADLPCWREFDSGGDRIEFVVQVEDEATHRLVLGTAKPEDLGMAASWEWTLVPRGDGRTQVTLTERGRIGNPMFRGLWSLREGPYAVIDLDLQGLMGAFSGG